MKKIKMKKNPETSVTERPWGKFEQFTLNEKTTVKILTIYPRQKFSLQFHHKRSELWRLLDNPAKVTVGKKTTRKKKDDTIFVPAKTLHRIEAYSKPVRVLEIAFGNFDEKDIERLEKISEQRNIERQALEEEEDEEDKDKIKIFGDLDASNDLSIQTLALDNSIKLSPDPLLNDIEVLV